MRPFGFYFVFITSQNAWVVAEWNPGGFWTLSGSSIQYADSDFGAIGAQITTPTPQAFPQTIVGLDFNDVSNRLLAVLGTASWTDPNTGSQMQFNVATRRQRVATNYQPSDFPWLLLIRPMPDTESPMYGLSVEHMKFEAWGHLFQDPNLGSNYVPDASLAAAENAMRSSLYSAYPINGVPGGYQQLPPGTPQTLGGLVQEVRVQGATGRDATPDGQPMVVIMNILVLTGNSF